MKLRRIKTSDTGLESIVKEMYSVELTPDDIDINDISDGLMEAIRGIKSNPKLQSISREELVDLVRASLAK